MAVLSILILIVIFAANALIGYVLLHALIALLQWVARGVAAIARGLGAARLLRVTARTQDVSRFREEVREAVASTAAAHPRLADLAASCPAALVAIAAPGPDALALIRAERGRALAIEGRSLGEVCVALDVPFWLRKARPETFAARPATGLPDSAAIRQAIGSFVPRGEAPVEVAARDPSRWLSLVETGFETADEAVGLWVAGCAARRPEMIWDHDLRLVALWAWFSVHAPIEDEPVWRRDLGWSAARGLACAWGEQAGLDIFGGPPDWARVEEEVEGFLFTPLVTRQAIIEEGEAMDHCIASYVDDVAGGESALWSLRRDEARVATLELGRCGGSDFVTVRQLFAHSNNAAPREAWRAATLFSLDRAEEAAGARPTRATADEASVRWQAFFAPYWAAKGGTRPWAPLQPTPRCLGL